MGLRNEYQSQLFRFQIYAVEGLANSTAKKVQAASNHRKREISKLKTRMKGSTKTDVTETPQRMNQPPKITQVVTVSIAHALYTACYYLRVKTLLELEAELELAISFCDSIEIYRNINN